MTLSRHCVKKKNPKHFHYRPIRNNVIQLNQNLHHLYGFIRQPFFFSISNPFCSFLQDSSTNLTSAHLFAGTHTHTFISSFQHAKGPAVTNHAGNDLCVGGCWLEDRESDGGEGGETIIYLESRPKKIGRAVCLLLHTCEVCAPGRARVMACEKT